jgi:hypothetical protein
MPLVHLEFNGRAQAVAWGGLGWVTLRICGRDVAGSGALGSSGRSQGAHCDLRPTMYRQAANVKISSDACVCVADSGQAGSGLALPSCSTIP